MPRGLGRWVAPVAAMLCVPAAVAVALLALHLRSGDVDESARAAGLTAARAAAEDILSYDYRNLDAEIAQARNDATGRFRTQYEETAGQLLQQAKQLKAIVQATVGSAAVESASNDRVVVLLFVDQASVKQLSAKAKPTTRIDQARVRMTMSRVGGRWLVSELAAL